MKYRLDAQHYINDRLLEPGHIVGDETDVPFRDRKGEPLIPSASMTPLDGDARSHFKKHFPDAVLPEGDAANNVPIHNEGSVEVGGPGEWVIGPDGKPTKELKKGLPDSGSPNHPVGQPVIGTVPGPGQAAHVPPKSADDHGQPPGAPLKSPATNTDQPKPTAPQPGKK